ncbi:valyl-tRNA synthetase [Achromatium sp. WMS3]|nr:valyl-tRNA synthetase [Achromatium sp. WMS3]
MDKVYDPHTLEQHWYQIWETKGYFTPQNTPYTNYCIMIPPPNVTGRLHMGHGFNNTIMDCLIRYHRMRGDTTLWQPGTDHAGIATQMVVERQLEAQGISKYDLGREEFIKRVWDWKAKSGGTITQQLRRLGSSLDWEHERFTMDAGLSKAVQEVFIRLYEDGLIYRGKRLVNWDPVLHTAVSDLEVLNEEEAGHLWHIRYPLANGTSYLVVATTRPETLLGDCAVAVHPGDERYKHLLGEWINLPLSTRRIPIIADEYVDPEFGTGCVKITPAHDFNDYEVWLRHRDEAAIIEQPHGGLINILTPNATLRDNTADEGTIVPTAYIGMDRYVARSQILADLKAQGILDKEQAHRLVIPRGDRSGAVIEPLLTDQWYVRMQPLAQPAINAVIEGQVRFVPDHWKNTYFNWMHNIQDWCISRQIWWGHRIPAWYDDSGNIYVGRSESAIRNQHNLSADYPLYQDPDVLDTWFSSALWPFSTLGWPENTGRLETFYPTNVLVTGFDIIFFWVARMLMMGLKFMQAVPFKEIYIHGLVRDAQGHKMSKSKGNILDPIDLIDGIDLEALVTKRTSGMMQPHLAAAITKQTRKEFPNGIPAFGTDALRYTFASLGSTGRDINFDLGRIAGARNFCNKIWNAARYVLLNTENQDLDPKAESIYSSADRWIISQLQQTILAVTKALDTYRFDLAAQAIYAFTWNEYCDWYLELSKPILNNPKSKEAEKRGTRRTLVEILETLLRLMHPIMPFITEEIWQRIAPLIGKQGPTIMLQPYPIANTDLEDPQAIAEMEWVMQCILRIRKIKGEMNIPLTKPVPILIANANAQEAIWAQAARPYLDFLAHTASVTLISSDHKLPEAAVALVDQMQLLIPLEGLIDKAAELTRLERELMKRNKELERSQHKLKNTNFLDRAPAAIVQKEQERVADNRSAIVKLEAQVTRIKAL